jgi:hypothetical protein
MATQWLAFLSVDNLLCRVYATHRGSSGVRGSVAD